MINCLKQIVQFGLNKQMHVAGTQQELESLAGLPPEARIGIWMFEWYWKQPGIAGVEKFTADIRKVNNGNVPTARHWFGYTSAHELCPDREPGEDHRCGQARDRAGEFRAAATTSSCSRTRSIIFSET